MSAGTSTNHARCLDCPAKDAEIERLRAALDEERHRDRELRRDLERQLDEARERGDRYLAERDRANRERDEAIERADEERPCACCVDLHEDFARASRERDEARAERDAIKRVDMEHMRAASDREATLRTENAKLRGALSGLAEYDCSYGDSCPTFVSRHGQCVGCIAREALRTLDGGPRG